MMRARILLGIALTAGLLTGTAPASPLGTVAPLADAPFDNGNQGDITSSDAQLQRQPARPKPPPAANPLWAIPLSALSETRERPLFSPSRRPPPVVANAPHRPPERLPPRPVPPEVPPLKLVGTVVGEAKGFGLFVDTSNKATVRLRTGSTYRGWVLRTVRERTVVMEKNHLNQTLALPTPARAQPVVMARPIRRPGRVPAGRDPPGRDPIDGLAVYH